MKGHWVSWSSFVLDLEFLKIEIANKSEFVIFMIGSIPIL